MELTGASILQRSLNVHILHIYMSIPKSHPELDRSGDRYGDGYGSGERIGSITITIQWGNMKLVFFAPEMI